MWTKLIRWRLFTDGQSDSNEFIKQGGKVRIDMIKTLYISTKNNAIRALRIRERLLRRGWIVMWAGENLICFMKK